MLTDLFTDQRYHDYQGPSRAVRHPRACTVGGGTFATSQDGSRCVVAGKDVLRILRVTDPPRSRHQTHLPMQGSSSMDPSGRLSTGSGGASIEASPNMWTSSGLKMDSAPTDVVWARGTFDNKIVTSAMNGEIIYWDINKPGSKCETRIKEHTRTVNKLAISSFLPYLIASGSQDGHLRIWDLRTPPSSSMKVYHPTGIRALALSPVPSNPLTVCTGLESGNIQRWDIRNKAAPLERITLAHSSSVLSMDWQLPSMKETGLGWLVTSGMDRRVKIWDLCLSLGASVPVNAIDRDTILLNKKMGPRAFRTLSTPFPVRNVCWRPGYDCEVAVVSNNESDSETVEIWDIRRGWIGKWALEGAEGGITDIAFSGSHALWAQHTNGTFAQHDLRASFRPLDAVPRVAMSWTASGTLAFVANNQPTVEVPFDDVHPQKIALLQDLHLRSKATSDPVYIPVQQTLGVQDVPLFDQSAFTRLAKLYIFDGDRTRICEVNAETASQAGQYRAAQTWLLLQSQLTDLKQTLSPSLYSLPPSVRNEPSSRLSSAPASVISRHTSESSSRPDGSHSMLIPNSHIDTQPMDTSPSSLYRSRDRSRHGQETPPSSGSSPRLKNVSLPTTDINSRSSWLESSRVSPHDASPLIEKSSVASRRASTALPMHPRAPRPALRRASMSTPSATSSNPVNAHVRGPKHAHVGEGALDDSDSSSGSDGSGVEDSSPNNAASIEWDTPMTSISPVARLGRSSKVLPSPLSKVVSRDYSPDGHLASDERSVGDSDASDASHSPPSTSSASSSDSRSGSSPRKVSDASRKERPRRSLTPSPTRNRSTGLSASYRSLSKQESQSSIRTVTAPPSDTSSARPSSIDRLSLETGEPMHDTRVTAVSSEGVSTRRPSPQRHRPSATPGLALGLSNMDNTRNGKENGHVPHAWSSNGRFSEAQALVIQDAEVQLRDIGWNALRESLNWFAEKGDVQMCALLSIVAPTELHIPSFRAARFVEAYVEILARLQLHSSAAQVRKYVPFDCIRDATQVQTTLYSSCGRCRTTVKPSPLGGPILCHNCKFPPTLCAICHLPVRKLLVHCPVCGHGGHQTCYRKFYLTRPLTELATYAIGNVAHGPTDSYSSTDSSSTMYYSLSDGSEREVRGEEGADEDEDEEQDGSNGRTSDRERGKEESHEYDLAPGNVSERRPKMRVLGHACAAGCGHWCWAANERFNGT